ncbi:MAG TPA: glycosyltransferase [Caulobacteraceae bacterium]|nr:glycosyltransferase [Caulobacteraceae bacterium]
MLRRIAIAIPARNEAERIGACLRRLGEQPADARIAGLRVVILANNCDDQTVGRARAFGADLDGRLEVRSVALAADRAHAGWARRLALDAAAKHLRDNGDVLMSTDADTVVARDWISRTLDHLDDGWAAVAGLARLDPRETRALAPAHRLRLARIRRYDSALNYLKALRDPGEPWPRHFYEGGASIALTLGAYRAIGGAPTPEVGEDKALFEALRAIGGRVRHALDVRVTTSARLRGRAPGGASDTLARWGRQGEGEAVAGIATLSASLGMTSAGPAALTFADLPAQTAAARRLVELARGRARVSEEAS